MRGRETDDHRPVRRSTAGRSGALIAVVLLALALAMLGAAPAPAVIDDGDALPSLGFNLNGPGNGNDTASDVVITGAATWVCGTARNASGNNDAAVVRIPTNTTGNPPFNLYDGPAHDGDAAYDLAVKGSYVYTAGSSMNAAGDMDLLVCRWSSTGAFKWAKRYAGPQGRDAFANDVVVDGKGNVTVCGTINAAEGPDWIVIKYSSRGRKLWSWKFDGKAHLNDHPSEMLIDGAGNVYITGSTATGATSTGAYTVKLSPAGKKLWGKTFGTVPDGRAEGSCLAFAPNKGVYVGGRTLVTGQSDNAFLLRYTAGGSRKTFAWGDGGGGDVPQWIGDIAVAANGQIIGVGWSGGGPATDPYWVRWDAGGTLDGQVSTVTAGFDLWTGVATDAFGGVYMTGLWDGPAALPQVLIRRSSVYTAGATWSHAFVGDTTDLLPQGIAVRGTTCVVAGYEGTNTRGNDWFIDMWLY